MSKHVLPCCRQHAHVSGAGKRLHALLLSSML